MTITPAELVDPGEAFLAAGDPARFLEDNLPAADEPGVEDGQRTALVALAGAFIAWRLWVVGKARAELSGPPPDPEGALGRLWDKHKPIWLRIAEPAVEQAMAGTGLTGDELRAVAADYAAGLGSYIHAMSAEAVTAGYREQLRRGVSPTLSWLRAMEGYGLTERPLRSWVAQQAVVEGPISDLISPGARRALDRAMLARADVLGANEAWHARQVAKSVAWMYAERRGEVPFGTRKRWLTREDERVCAVCGPLHEQEVGLSDRFVLPNGARLWAPGVHPNCRCELALVYPKLVVEKAVPGDPFDRDPDGQFARQETRLRKVPRPMPVKEREPVDPVVAAMLASVGTEPTEEEVSLLDDAPSLLGSPSLLEEGVSLFADSPSLFDGGPSLLADGPTLLGARPRTTGRKIRVHVLRDGRMQEVEVDEDAGTAGTVYLPVDEFYAHSNDHAPVRPGDPAEGVPDFRVGDVVDVDEFMALADWDAWRHAGTSVPAMVRGHAAPEGASLEDYALPALSGFYIWTDSASDFESDFADELAQTESEIYGDVWRDLDGYFELLDNEEIASLVHDAHPSQPVARAMTPLQQRAWLAEQVEALEEGEHSGYLEDAILTHIAEYHPLMRQLQATVTASDRIANTLHRPQVFVFRNGAEGWETSDNNRPVPLIGGKWRVVEVRSHVPHRPANYSTDNRRPPQALGRNEHPNLRIRAWREVVLEKVE